MIYPVKIQNFSADGKISFEMRGNTYRATHTIDAQEADGLIEPGATYPLLLVINASSLDYIAENERGLETLEEHDSGDTLRVKGRITDYLEHDIIRLDGEGSIQVRLKPPLQSTDFRRGSWLMAEGRLEAAIAPPDH